MRRKVFLLSAGAAVVAAFLLALGSYAPAAHADDSSMSWDVAIYEEGELPPHCTNNLNDIIETGECPDVESNLWIQTEQTLVSDEPYFDLANSVWTADGYQVSTTQDLDGDTVADPGYIIPVNGLRATPGALMTDGATVGNITFQLCGNVVPASVAFAQNIDDIALNADATVRGQPAECDVNVSQFNDSFDIWGATLDTDRLADIYDDACDADGDPQTQGDYFSAGQDCDALPPCGGIPNGMPDGIDCTPEGLIPTLNASGLLPSYQGRAYGIAELQITEFISTYVDVNFLVFNLLTEPQVSGYLNLTMVLYPDMPTQDPTDPGYKPTNQTVLTCPPYYAAPVRILGVTADSDFDGNTVIDPAGTGLGGQINRQVIGAAVSGPYDDYINKSTVEDYDGDTLADYKDRCEYDPASGTAAQDLDGDTLTGLCDDNEDATCPAGQTLGCPGNPQDVAPAGWNTTPPWDSGQDQDGDTFINVGDNCPQHANGAGDPSPQLDTDGDTLGDVCEIALYGAGTELIPGNDDGYAAPAPGMFLDHDNRCVDQFSIGQPESRSDPGVAPPGAVGAEAKYCYVPETFATTQPYVNPPLWHLNAYYEDSNDDGDPDWGDSDADTVYDVGEPIDPHSNTDNPDPGGTGDTGDYESDACEAACDPRTDALDPASNNGSGTPTMMDCDGDNVSDEDEKAALVNQVDIIDGKIDVDEDGDVDAVDDQANVLLRLEGGGTDQVDIIDGMVDVNEDGTVDAADNLSDVLLVVLIVGKDRVDIIAGMIDVNENGTVGTEDDQPNVLLVIIVIIIGGGTDMCDPQSFPPEITKAIVSLDVDGDWYQVNPAPAGSENDPLPPGVPDLPHADPPAAIQLDVCTPTVITTDALDWSSAEIWIDETHTMTVTAGNCTVDGGAVSVWGPENLIEYAGWTVLDPVAPGKPQWTIHLGDDAGCTIQYTVVKNEKPTEALYFDEQTVNLTINVGPPTACVFAGDADCDACYDIREPGLTPPANSADAWDFYDVPVPTLFSGGHISGDPSGTDSRDHAISIINDVLAVLEYSGCSDGGPANAAGRQYNQDVNGDTVNDGQAYDRSVGATRSGTPDGAVTIIVDVLLVLAQSGQACAAP